MPDTHLLLCWLFQFVHCFLMLFVLSLHACTKHVVFVFQFVYINVHKLKTKQHAWKWCLLLYSIINFVVDCSVGQLVLFNDCVCLCVCLLDLTSLTVLFYLQTEDALPAGRSFICRDTILRTYVSSHVSINLCICCCSNACTHTRY